MPDHALKLFTGQLHHSAAGNRDDSIGGAHPGSKGIDATFFIQYVQRRHRHIGRQREFLHDILRAPFQWVGCGGYGCSRSQRLGYRSATLRKAQPIDHNHDTDDGRDGGADA